MISTKINVDTSELLKAFKLLESQGKLTADNIDKAFNNSLKIEVDSSDFKKIETEATTMFGKLKNNLKGSFDMSQILNFSAGGLVTGAVEKGLSLVAEGFSQAIEKGSEFEKQLNAVGAVTGQSGEALDKIGESALELSKTFGGDANAQLGAFQGILSKFGAQLAETPQYLNEVTKNVNLLAKAGGIDATTAMNSLTDVMMQFGVDVTNGAVAAEESARYMNVLAASAQVGSAEITDVSASILQVGVTAKSAGLSLEETNSAIQILAGGGKKGSEAGVALRNSLQYLQKQSGEGEKVLAKMGLTTLQLGKTLGKEGLDNTLKLVSEGLKKLGGQTEQNQAMFQLFGADASAMGILLKGAGGQMDEFTKAMTGTQSGVEQAKVNMQGFTESMSRLKANIDAGLIKSFMVVKQAIADLFVFIKPLLDLWYELFQATTLTLWGNIFSTVFGIVKKTFMDTYNSVKEIVDIFSSMFGEAESGIDIIGILATTFEFLGRYIGTLVTLPFQALHKILQGVLYVVKELILFVKGLGDRFNDFVNSNKMVSDFVEAVTEKFRQLGKWISESAKSVKGFLQSIGLLSKDKGTKDLNKDLKETAKTTEEVKTNIEATTPAVVKQKAEVKSLQQQYDELYKKTLEIAGNSKFEIKYQTNLKKLQELKDEIEGNNVLKMKVDFDLKGGISWDDRNKLINDYLKNDVEVDEIAIRPKELTFALKNISVPSIPIKSVKVADEFYDNLEKDIAKNFQNVTANINFKTDKSKMKGLLDELNNNTQSELDNLSNSLMSANISYEEYSEQKADILRNAKEQELQIEREHQSNLMTLINETTAQFLASFKNRYDMNLSQLADYESKGIELTKNTTKAKEELDNASLQYSLNQNDANKKILEDKQIAYNTLNNELIANTEKATMSMSDIYTNMAISMGASLGEAIIQGKNAFDTIVGLAFDFLDKLVPIWSAQILGYALATPDAIASLGATALAKWTALTLIMKAAVAGARNIAGYKDGVINLQGAGTSTSDSIPAMLSKGESVINARSTAQNEPYLRFINNGGDMSKLVNMNMNTKNIENLLYTNNELLRSKNFNPNINNINKFNVSSSSIKVVRGR